MSKRVDVIKYLTRDFCMECGEIFVKDEHNESYCPKCGYMPYNPLVFNYVGLKKVGEEYVHED